MEVRLFIAIPSCRDWKFAFGSSFAGLIHRLALSQLNGQLKDFQLYTMTGVSILSRAREIAIRKARDQGFTHILMLDDDMTFPSDIVEKLLAHDLSFVAANYCRKVPGEPKSISFDMNGGSVDSKGKTGIEEVSFVGAGINLINLEAIKDIPSPLFEVRWDENRQDYWGEDMYFCGKLRGHGVKIFIDHDISQKVGHIGDYEYKFDVDQMVQDVKSRIAEVKKAA